MTDFPWRYAMPMSKEDLVDAARRLDAKPETDRLLAGLEKARKVSSELLRTRITI